MKKFYRIMLGKKSIYASECFAGNYIGTGSGWFKDIDLNGKLPEDWREFNRQFIPIYLSQYPEKSKVTAGLACGALWNIAKGLKIGDIVLCPDGEGSYRVGEIAGDYSYARGASVPHRRPVRWLGISIPRSSMSETLRNSTGSIGTICDISGYQAEIEGFLGETLGPSPVVFGRDPEIEDPLAFAMEKHLEVFLVDNWNQTLLGKDYDILHDEGEMVGQQYATDAGPIDILAISKDKKRLLIVELKRGRASDVVVGQILRYMGFVKEEVAEPDQAVEGAIIALEEDPKLRWALVSVPSISFYRYQVSFKLLKG